jgi:hypothetical protein
MPVNFPIPGLPGVTLDIGDATSSDVLTAIAANQSFPDRPIDFPSIFGSFSTGTVNFPGSGGTVSGSFSFSSSFQTGFAIDKNASNLLSKLSLNPAVTLDFQNPTAADRPNDRFICMSFAAKASESVSGTSPIGMVGSASFGVSGSEGSCFAIIHRFNVNDHARDVIAALVNSLRMPSQLNAATDVQPATWILAEVDGTVSTTLSAKLGYTLIKTEDLQWLGTSHSVGAKIDASITASLGFNVAGAYLLVIGRPSSADADQNLHLQLFKQIKDGWNIGLDLTAGIQADPQLPASPDDFISGVLGTYGPQVVKDLHSIENWTQGDLGDNLAALTTQTAKNLLQNVAQKDPNGQLAEAVGILKDALSQWDNLSQNGSAELQSLAWQILGNPDNAERQTIQGFLNDLVNPPTSFTQTFSDLLQHVEGRQWLLGIADVLGSTSGLALVNNTQAQSDIKKVQGVAQDVLNILTGNTGQFFDRLKTYIAGKFNLGDISQGKISDWAQQRLAKFFDSTVLSSAQVKDIQNAIQTLQRRGSELYAKIQSAINARYSFDFSTKYERNNVDSALIDVNFDCAQGGAWNLLQQVLSTSGTNLFDNDGQPIPGVTINQAVLTHEIHTSATTHIGLLSFSSTTRSLNDTVAKLTLEQNGARLVAYVDATDTASVTNRYSSILQLQDTLTINGTTQPPAAVGSVSYEMRMIGKSMSGAMLEFNTSDFATTYLSDKFPDRPSYENQFLKGVDVAITRRSGSPNMLLDDFGDVAISLQVALDSNVLTGWFTPREQQLAAVSADVSRTIQLFLRKYTVLTYFQDVSRYSDISSAAAVLLWAALPLCAGADWDSSTATLRAINTNDGVYWENSDPRLVRVMSNLPQTTVEFHRLLGQIVPLLPTSTFPGTYYAAPGAVNYFRTLVLGTGSISDAPSAYKNLDSLLSDEGTVVQGAADALKAASEAAADIQDPTSRSDARKALAEFGNKLTSTLNSGLANIYTGDLLRVYAPMLFVELAKVLSPGSSTGSKSAMLQLYCLKQGHSFDLNSFLTGSVPNISEVAVPQTVVSTGLSL